MTSGYYNLYLDECKMHKDKIYGIIGVAIEQSNLSTVRRQMGDIKINVWPDLDERDAKNIVFHATEIHRVNKRKMGLDKLRPNYQSFRSNNKCAMAFNGISDIVSDNDLTIFGCTVNMNSIANQYKTSIDNYTADSICLNNVINNFSCFLKWHNAKGCIIFESRASNQDNKNDSKLKKQFYKIMTHGTAIYKPIELQGVIDSISFIKKQENDAGLQIADMIAQPFLYNSSKKRQRRPNIYSKIRPYRYSGRKTKGEMGSNVFGVIHIE
ncbi:DUF3800 domain-containing protein [Enterococcus asini]|uniref:DUF3800 domain-containing protein n=1 Tax=Enterococcus asini TaxID=57732 RepID=UPI0022E29075|nr:DUF3800 domain-containing protein [Enterococcus asini]